ncbi:MAG: hypothetical protein IID36_09265 [Planctomycetes bacterium]|nr:hypothetical protein [Planctomycetota bacterium]
MIARTILDKNAVFGIGVFVFICLANTSTVSAQFCQGTEYSGVCFPSGDVSFADLVIQYDPEFGGNPAPGDPEVLDPTHALGAPDYDGTAAGAVSLGQGGLLELAFTDNLLANSGDPGADLYVFEVGAKPEAMSIALQATPETAVLLAAALISPNADGWYEVGDIGGATLLAIDVDGYFNGFAAGALLFDAVQIIDDPTTGESTGATPGADIDAVGAITSAGNPNPPNGGGSGSCCEAHDTPGCDNQACEVTVCAEDAFCCDTEWDDFCLSDACDLSVCDCSDEACAVVEQPGDCCVITLVPTCTNTACEAVICAADAFCCETEWDVVCVEAACAEAVCNCPDDGCAGDGGDSDPPGGGGGGGGPPVDDPVDGEGACCEANGSPGCADPTCQDAVCGADAYCCDTEWDSECVLIACADDACACGSAECDSDGDGDDPAEDPDPEPEPGEGDCCKANGSLGCDDAVCQVCVCAFNALCCSFDWGASCALVAGGGCEDACLCSIAPDEPEPFRIDRFIGDENIMPGEPGRALSVVYTGEPEFPVTMILQQTLPSVAGTPLTMPFDAASSDKTLVVPDLLACEGAATEQTVAYDIVLRDTTGRETPVDQFTFTCLALVVNDPAPTTDEPTPNDDEPIIDQPNPGDGQTGGDEPNGSGAADETTDETPGDDNSGGSGGGGRTRSGFCASGMVTTLAVVLAGLFALRFARSETRSSRRRAAR